MKHKHTFKITAVLLTLAMVTSLFSPMVNAEEDNAAVAAIPPPPEPQIMSDEEWDAQAYEGMYVEETKEAPAPSRALHEADDEESGGETDSVMEAVLETADVTEAAPETALPEETDNEQDKTEAPIEATEAEAPDFENKNVKQPSAELLQKLSERKRLVEEQAVYDELSDEDEPATPVPESRVIADENENDEDIPEYEPLVHEETINQNIEFDETEYEKQSLIPKAPSVSLLSTNSDTATWKEKFTSWFGEDILKPYAKKDGQRVTGNTNKLVIEETDLSLEGKNGLNLVIKRKYDSQNYGTFYSGYKNAYGSYAQSRYIYSFNNISTGAKVNIGFLTKDHIYVYNMSDVFYVTGLNYTLQSDNNIQYYKFEDIYSGITDDTSKIKLQYDPSVPMQAVSRYQNTSVKIDTTEVAVRNGYLYNGWSLVLPQAYLFAASKTYTDNDPKHIYHNEYVGLFSDINGNAYMLNGMDTVKIYTNGAETVYTSSFYADDNKFLTIEKYYKMQKITGTDLEYNFVVYDNAGYTYYFYDFATQSNGRMRDKQKMYITAIEDKYGNKISYEYNYDLNNLSADMTKIIDTYGREINVSHSNNTATLSYYDSGETKAIKYTQSILPASSLNNDSSLKNKEVYRFTVTNPLGEQTIYDSRQIDVMNFYATTLADINKFRFTSGTGTEIGSGYNIERIQYPTGAETRYHYKPLYHANKYLSIMNEIYAVDKKYDLINNSSVNRSSYSFSSTLSLFDYDRADDITKTTAETDAGRNTVTKYSKKGMEITINTASVSNPATKRSVQYSYNDKDKPVQIVTTEGNQSQYMYYSYNNDYPMLVTSESDGKYKISYKYHYTDYKQTNLPEKTTYSIVNSSNSETEDFHITTTLTADHKSIAQEQTIKNNLVKSQLQYEYDSEGNITKVKQWRADTNNDGALNDSDDVVINTNTYTATAQKTKTVSNTIPDIKNADGTNEGAVTQAYGFNIYGSPASMTDSYGTVTQIEYDSLNRPVKYTLPNGGIRTVEYNTPQNYAIATDETGVKTKYQYDGLGRIKGKYAFENNSWLKLEDYTYDICGRLSQKISYRQSNKGTQENYTYDALDRVTEKKVYDKTGSSVYSKSLKYTESYTYSTSGTKTITKTTAASGLSPATEKSYYDERGNLTKTELISGNTTLTAQYAYDYLSRKTSETDPNNNTTSYEYDCFGNVTKVIYPDNTTVSTAYDMAGQPVSVTDANGNTTVTEYDKALRAIRVTTPFNNTNNGETKTYYDKNSNIIKTAVKRGSSTYDINEFVYDSMNRRTADIVKGGNSNLVAQYEYDLAGRRTKMITGLISYSANPAGGAVTQYSYDQRGNLAQITDAMGQTETYSSYDYAGNLLSKTDRNGTSFTYTYGVFGLTKEQAGSGEKKEYTYDNLGRQTASFALNADGTTASESFTYDNFGRVISKTSSSGDTQNYTYDSNSNITAYTLTRNGSTKNSLTYAYNEMNRLTSLSGNGIITSYDYDSNGNLTNKSLSNGVETVYTYNQANMLTNLVNKNISAVFEDYNCSYLLDGLKNYEYDSTNNADKNYYYDKFGRLILEGVQANNTDYDTEYEYDSRGNIIKKASINYAENTSILNNYTYDLNNRIISRLDKYDNNSTVTRTYTCDNNGNLLQKSAGGSFAAESYEYDAFNRLKGYSSGSTTAGYTYYADNLRASKTVNGSTKSFTWNGQNLAAETSGSTTSAYTYDMTGIHMSRINNTRKSFLKDTHGNVVGTASLTGIKSSNVQNYTAYGESLGTTPDPFGYCGEYYDSETGLIYLRNRYYDSTAGSFITEDPIRDGLNWYGYCAGNPVGFVDPSGTVPKERAEQLISENATSIISAGREFGVNPGILAACIYAEQVLNVSRFEGEEDYIQALIGLDCSVGISQVRISTAEKVEDAGYISYTHQTEGYTYLFTNPFNGKAVYTTYTISRESKIYDKLISNDTNIRYAAAYLALIQDKWKEVYPEIDGRTAVLGTLYNIGEEGSRGPNSTPETNEFGEFAKRNYYKMLELLGL